MTPLFVRTTASLFIGSVVLLWIIRALTGTRLPAA